MTILDLVQLATENKHHRAAIDAPAHGIAPRPPLTAEGMAAYAGVMATFTGTDGDDVVTMTLAQWASFDTIDLGGGTDVLNVVMDEPVDISALGVPSISGVETGNLIGTTATRGAPVTLSGEQLDAIIIGAGKIDFSAAYQFQNKISLTSTSADLNTMADASIVGLDYIDARLATAGVTINLSAQSEGFIIYGSAQADTITSGSGNVAIVGGAGADTIVHGGGDGGIVWYDGSDVSIAGGGVSTLGVDGAGGATIDLSASDQTFGDTAIVTGFNNVYAIESSAAVSLTGDANANRLWGGYGADTINGGAGDDWIRGDGSDVSIAGGSGIDTLRVTGVTTINLSQVDQTSGDTANVTGFENVDAADSNVGVSLTGDAGANRLSGSYYADMIDGGAGNDTISGGGGGTIFGGDGDDDIFGGVGVRLDGGTGNDRVFLEGSEFSIAGGAGNDTLFTYYATTIDLSLVDQTSGDTANVTGFENVNVAGSDYAYSLTGSDDANTVTGGTANDTIAGGDGDDTISGGSGTFTALYSGYTYTITDDGADWIDGGGGNDTITFDGADVSIVGGTGTDTLIVTGAATINLSLADQSSGDTANVTGFENVDASNSSAAVSITGDANANKLTGGSGNDTINGGAGNDTITFDGSDVSIAGGAGTDTLIVTGAATIDLSGGNISGFEIVDASTSTAAVSLTGDANANRLTGGSGNDTISGGAGADTIDGGTGTDTLIVTGAATINLSLADQTSGDTANVTGFENVDASTSSAAVSLTGDANANKLTGGSGDDTISGGVGADMIDGGEGDDTIKLANGDFAAGESLKGGTGIDTIVLTNATEVDFSTGMFSGLNALTGSSGGDTVTMTVKQWAGFATLDLGAGTDVLNVKVAGTVDISGLGTPAVLNVETGNLTGTSGDDRLTLTGAQLNAILDGPSSKIDLGAGDDDTIYLTSDSTNITNLNAHGDDKIAGVEAISAASATAGVSISLSNQTEAFTLTGGSGNDTITGGKGNDTIVGLKGNDTLTGSAGKDTFIFDTALNASSNVDKITDFSVGDDTVRLENSVFTALATGTLAAGAFYVGTAAHDASDRIIYNKTTGALTYDSNGNAAGGAVQFATLSTNLALTNADFMVV